MSSYAGSSTPKGPVVSEPIPIEGTQASTSTSTNNWQNNNHDPSPNPSLHHPPPAYSDDLPARDPHITWRQRVAPSLKDFLLLHYYAFTRPIIGGQRSVWRRAGMWLVMIWHVMLIADMVILTLGLTSGVVAIVLLLIVFELPIVAWTLSLIDRAAIDRQRKGATGNGTLIDCYIYFLAVSEPAVYLVIFWSFTYPHEWYNDKIIYQRPWITLGVSWVYVLMDTAVGIMTNKPVPQVMV